MDIKIEKLVIEKDRPEHIARHDVTIEEVKEIIGGNYVFIKSREKKWLLIGKTKKGRFLAIVIGERGQKDTFGLVTARPADKKERNFYQEFVFQIGGEEDGQNSES